MLQTCTQCGSCGSGQREHPGSGGSHWKPLTIGLGSLWSGLGPLHWYNFPSGLGALGQAWVRPLAGPPAPQGCTPGAAENKPGVPKPSRQDKFGGCHPQGALGVGTTARAMGRWWGTSNSRSDSFLLHLHPRGHPAIEGALGAVGCPPDLGFALALLAFAPGTGAGTRGGRRSDAGGCAQRGAGRSRGAPGQAGLSC